MLAHIPQSDGQEEYLTLAHIWVSWMIIGKDPIQVFDTLLDSSTEGHFTKPVTVFAKLKPGVQFIPVVQPHELMLSPIWRGGINSTVYQDLLHPELEVSRIFFCCLDRLIGKGMLWLADHYIIPQGWSNEYFCEGLVIFKEAGFYKRLHTWNFLLPFLDNDTASIIVKPHD